MRRWAALGGGRDIGLVGNRIQIPASFTLVALSAIDHATFDSISTGTSWTIQHRHLLPNIRRRVCHISIKLTIPKINGHEEIVIDNPMVREVNKTPYGAEGIFDDSEDLNVIYRTVSVKKGHSVPSEEDVVIIQLARASNDPGDALGWHSIYDRDTESFFPGSQTGNFQKSTDCGKSYTPWVGDGGSTPAWKVSIGDHNKGSSSNRGWKPFMEAEWDVADNRKIVSQEKYIPMCLTAQHWTGGVSVTHLKNKCGVIGRHSLDVMATNCPTPDEGGTSGGSLTYEHNHFGSVLVGINQGAYCNGKFNRVTQTCKVGLRKFDLYNYNIVTYADILPLREILDIVPEKEPRPELRSWADPLPLPIAPPHTSQRSDILARFKYNGPLRPSSQEERSQVGQHNPGIDPFTNSLVRSCPCKKALYNSYSPNSMTVRSTHTTTGVMICSLESLI